MNRRLVVTTMVVALGSILAACVPPKKPPPPAPELPPPPPDQGPPPNSPTLASDTGFVTGLNNPWDMAFLPDGTMLFTERGPGTVKVRLPNGVIQHVVTPDDISVSSLNGMMGIAASSNLIFVCYTATNDVRVVRYEVNATLNGVVNSAVLVDGISPDPFRPFGCRVRFGPDAALWITTGDAFESTAPQDLNSLNGKTLRINGDGSAPADNPFVGQPGDDRIYTFGHRNPQGLAFQPVSGQAYGIDHGTTQNDEVNQLVPGGNGGWDPVPVYDETQPMTDLQKFPDAMIPAWRSGDFSTVAPSGGTFLTGSQWKSWANQLVVAFLKDGNARVMFLDGNGNVEFATPILANGVRLRSAVQGPDGNLYISTDVGGGLGAIWKVTPS
jgi:aldose sugar dehydrogenase